VYNNRIVEQKLDRDEIISALEGLGAPADVRFFETTDSTNTRVTEMFSQGNRPPFCVVAAEQTKGRGRLSRTWFGKRDCVLCISVAAELPKDAAAISSFTVRCGLRVCEELSKACGAKLFLKWPNDIYSAEGGKIAGMLSELKPLSAEECHLAVLGVGVNCDFSLVPPFMIPEKIRETACDLASVSETPLTINTVAAIVAKAVYDTSAETDFSGLPEKFKDFDWLEGREISVDCGGETLSGSAAGVDASGRLGLRAQNGEISYLSALEATIIKKPETSA